MSLSEKHDGGQHEHDEIDWWGNLSTRVWETSEIHSETRKVRLFSRPVMGLGVKWGTCEASSGSEPRLRSEFKWCSAKLRALFGRAESGNCTATLPYVAIESLFFPTTKNII